MTYCYNYLQIYFFFSMSSLGRKNSKNADIRLLLPCWTSRTISSEIRRQQSPM